MKARAPIVNILCITLLTFGIQLSQVAAQPGCMSEIETAEINGTMLHYFECGEGEPLVFVHGGLGDYRTWIGQTEAFSKEYRVLSYSRRYHYPNPWPQDASSFSASVHAIDLAAFIQALDLGAVHLVGHSYGALTSLLVARDNPELVRSLTLGEPPAFSLLMSTSEGDSLLQSFIENAIVHSNNAFERGNIEDGVRIFINGVLGEGSYEKLPPIVHIFMLENAREMKGEMKGINDQGVDLFPAFSCGNAEQITTPTLLLDGAFSPEMFGMTNDILERCLPTVERAVIPEASHDLKIQEPPVFSKTVLPFLTQY